MNKIVREHYPVENLPADLRQGLEGGTVTVTLEEDASKALTIADVDAILRNTEPMTLSEIRSRLKPKGLSPNEAVERIRALRDEWD